MTSESNCSWVIGHTFPETRSYVAGVAAVLAVAVAIGCERLSAVLTLISVNSFSVDKP